MSRKLAPLPFDERNKNKLLRSVTPLKLGALSAAVLAFAPKPAVAATLAPDLVVRLTGSAGELLLSKVPNKLSLAILGFLAGYSTARGINWLRYSILRSLFAYRGWVYSHSSYKAKAWALLIKLLRGPSPHATFAFQPYLPKQPVPDLDASLEKWLTMAKHILTADEFEQTIEAVEEFKETVGPKLQTYLLEKYRTSDNYIADYWVNLAYLAGRDSLAVNSNYYLINGTHATLTTDPIARAATTVYCHLEYYRELRNDRVAPHMLNDLVPLCMHGFRYILNTVRVPGEAMDSIQRYPYAKHIVVIRRGHFFKLDIVAQDPVTRRMRSLTVDELYTQFLKIQQTADALPSEPPVAALTSQNRTTWAKKREVLQSQNEETLLDVESAIFLVCMDDFTPKDTSDFSLRCMTGNGDDRWFDKSVTLITSPTGLKLGWNVEHSNIDAMVLGMMTEHSFVMEHRMYNQDGSIKPDPVFKPRALKEPARLAWNVAGMEDDVNAAYQAHLAVSNDLDLCAMSPPFGKGIMKKCKVSPDGFIQMALQLAYYRLHKEIPRTYEPSTSRMFMLGRTETVHVVSADSVAWVKSMDDPASMNQSRVEYLKRAIKVQTKFRLDATVGNGCDRHLFGLFCASRELGMDVPKLFMDKAWRMPFKLSTSQTPTKAWEYGGDLDYWGCAGGFGPSCKDGYGICYILIGDDIINFHITSWKSCAETDTQKFACALTKAFHDMKELFFSSS